jgi:hypothetical protein
VVAQPTTRGGRPGRVSSPVARTPPCAWRPGWPATARRRTQSNVDRRVATLVYSSSPVRAARSGSVGGMTDARVASPAPAASSASYTSGSACRSSNRHRCSTLCGCTNCGTAGRNALAAAASTSEAGSTGSRSSKTTSWPARAESKAVNWPAALPPTTTIRITAPSPWRPPQLGSGGRAKPVSEAGSRPSGRSRHAGCRCR